MISNKHRANANKHMDEGLQWVEKGNIDKAVESFTKSALEFESAQDFRRIPALWQAVADLLEPKFKEKYKDKIEHFRKSRFDFVNEEYYQWPLDHRIIPWTKWKDSTKESIHRQAWGYQWAAEHWERASVPANFIIASILFLKAAEKAEQTECCKKGDYNWPGKLYYRSVLNYIRGI